MNPAHKQSPPSLIGWPYNYATNNNIDSVNLIFRPVRQSLRVKTEWQNGKDPTLRSFTFIPGQFHSNWHEAKPGFPSATQETQHSTRRCQLILCYSESSSSFHMIGVNPIMYLKGIMSFLKSLWYCVCGICLFFPQHNFVQQYVGKTVFVCGVLFCFGFFVVFFLAPRKLLWSYSTVSAKYRSLGRPHYCTGEQTI